MYNDTNKRLKKNKHRGDIKENFCPPCLLALPLAFAGSAAAGSAIADSVDGKDKSSSAITVENDEPPKWYHKPHIVIIIIIVSLLLTYVFYINIKNLEIFKGCIICA